MLKQWVTRLLDRAGVEVRRKATLANFFRTHPIDLVIDAGADAGQFARSIRRKGYAGRIWSFEPAGYAYGALERASAADPKWRTSRIALGKIRDQLEVAVDRADHSGVKSFRGTSGPRETVAIEPLDDLLANDPARRLFLRIDVQGYERQVLDGAGKTLERTHAISICLPTRETRDEAWRLPEAIAYLDALGFAPAQFQRAGTRPTDPASATEFDCLMVRKDAC